MDMLPEALQAYDDALATGAGGAVSLAPFERERATYERGRVLAAMGRLGEALEAYDAAVSLATVRVEALSSRAVTRMELGRLDEAHADLDALLELAPEEPLGFYNRACVYARQGRLSDALPALARALELDPSLADGLETDADLAPLRAETDGRTHDSTR